MVRRLPPDRRDLGLDPERLRPIARRDKRQGTGAGTMVKRADEIVIRFDAIGS
jgi:hypothetical protein